MSPGGMRGRGGSLGRGGFGQVRGRGRGHGPGQGRGIRRKQQGGEGSFQRVGQTVTPQSQEPRQRELDKLRRTAASMEHQKADVERRIEDIEAGKAPTPRRPKPVVSAEQCTGCGICIDICPAEAIVVVNGTATISDDCAGCGVCVAECPNGALSLV